MSHDIMIDLETLATTPDAAIISIGAVRFDLDGGLVFDGTDGIKCDYFYTTVHVDSQNRHISTDTIAWWMGQTKAAQSVFSDPKKCGLEPALMDLADWIKDGLFTAVKPLVWSNGADFDLPMLAHAYKQAGLKLPWEPYAARCYRTYKNLPDARTIKGERPGSHHNALDDAIYQARHLCAIHAALFGKKQGGAA